MTHQAPGMPPVPCMRESHGRCFICERIDPGSPDYSEHYRRLFHPEEFPEEPPAVMSTPEPVARSIEPTPSSLLAGDLLAAFTARVGADRAAKWVATKLGTDCGCASRQAALNALDAKLRRFLGW